MPDEILLISYFDQIIGPNLFYCSCSHLLKDFEHPDLGRILEYIEEKGTFIFAFRRYQTINHIFEIKSDLARGSAEIFMITYMVRSAYFKNEVEDVFRYLESKSEILEDYASEMKQIEELPRILELGRQYGYTTDLFKLGPPKFIRKFLYLYNNYFSQLSPRFKFEFMSKSKIKKVLIFGSKGVGKVTFLKSIEDMQFRSQSNKSLSTGILELVIENTEILRNECIEDGFKCLSCPKPEKCLPNCEALIFLYNPLESDKMIEGKKDFQRMIKQFREMKYKPKAILIVANQFEEEYSKSDNLKHFEELKQIADDEISIKCTSINIVEEKEKLMSNLRWLVKNLI